MKWIRFTLDTHTDAVDMLSYMLDEIGVEGIEIEDHLPLSEEDKKKCSLIFCRIRKIMMELQSSLYMEPENCDPEKVMIQVQNIFQEIKPFCEIGKGTISLSETEDKDWINNWKTFFKPFRRCRRYRHQANLGKNIKKKKIPIFLSKSTPALLSAPVPTRQRNFVFRHLINM